MSMNWERAETAAIDEMAFYLVQDNGMEWRDHDLHVMKGYLVRARLEPQIVRGRPVWVAKIVRPVDAVSSPVERDNG